jgi:hypothetical protein
VENLTTAREGSAVAVPAAQRWGGVDRDAVDVDLEVEVAADGDRVAGLADGADPLSLPEALAAVDRRRPRQVGVEVAAALPFAVDQDVVAVEDRVVAGAQDAAVGDGDQLGLTGCDDVEALVGAAARARRAKRADVATSAVRTLDREDVAVEGDAAVAGGETGRGGRRQRREEDEGEKSRALQWCSMTRSTMLYSTASSALMK